MILDWTLARTDLLQRRYWYQGRLNMIIKIIFITKVHALLRFPAPQCLYSAPKSHLEPCIPFSLMSPQTSLDCARFSHLP